MRRLPFWREQTRLHHQEFAIIGPNGDVRVTYGCPIRHHRGVRCDRCGVSLLDPKGLVVAVFAFNRPGLAYIECDACLTRNTRTVKPGKLPFLGFAGD